MKPVTRTSALFAATLWLATGHAEAMDRNSLVAQNTAQIVRIYEDLLRGADVEATRGGDLELHCKTYIFEMLAKGYMESISRAAELSPAAIGPSLDEFGRVWFQLKEQRKLTEFYRPGATKEVILAFRKAYVAHAEKLGLGIHSGPINLGEISEKVITDMMSICSTGEFHESISGKLPEPDFTIAAPLGIIRNPHGKVEWIRDTQHGGFKAVWKTN